MFRGINNKFNRGEIDEPAMAREDVEKVHNSGSLVTNWLPFRLGGMMYRPGLGEFLRNISGESFLIPFVAATDDVAIVEMKDNLIRIWVDDALLIRTGETSVVTNGAFTSNLTGWTDASGAGSTTAWKTGGYASLLGSGSTDAVLHQTIGATDTGTEHAIRIVVARGEITLKLGTSGVGSHDLYEGTLDQGVHSLVFTPESNVTITISASTEYEALVDSVTFEGAATLALPTDIDTAALPSIRYAQSADVIYLAYDSGRQIQIERRGVKSWSVTDHLPKDGPFGKINSGIVTLTAGALSGDTTLTASAEYFEAEDVGSLFKAASAGQNVEASVTAEDDGTGSIFVTGVGPVRHITVVRSGTWVGTVTLQRSTDDATWSDVTTYTTNGTVTYDDNLANAELYYRLWVKTGDYTSGTVVLSMQYAGGSIEGIARVTEYTSPTVVGIQVLQNFGSTKATRDWWRDEWSNNGGYPTAVALYESRLWWAGRTKIWGSVSDAYTSFDTGIEGDSAAIRKTIGFGPVDDVLWLASTTRLLVGIASDEISVRSSSFGEVLTQNNTNLKSGSNQGAANIAPVIVDSETYFVQRSGVKLFSLAYAISNDTHIPADLNTLHQTICSPGIKRIAVVRQPETRIFVVLNDGTARVYLMDPVEEVTGWSRIETDGTIEDVITLPGVGEDLVYWVVSRTSGRYLEKMAKLSEAVGGTISKHLDSFITYTSPGTTITGLGHLEGKTVGVWADGQDRGTYTVVSGDITVGSAWTDVVVGLVHTSDWISSKLAGFLPKNASVMGLRKRIVDTGLIMMNHWPGALKIGPTEALLKGMPLIERGTTLDATATVASYDEVPFAYDGIDEVDPRIHLRATGPCTILALHYGVKDPRSSPGAEG